jgi:hypothetical protein
VDAVALTRGAAPIGPARTGGSTVPLPGGEPEGDPGARVEAQLIEDVLDVVLGGAFGDVQPAGDLTVAQPVRDQAGDLFLAYRQWVRACFWAFGVFGVLDSRRFVTGRRATPCLAWRDCTPLADGGHHGWRVLGRALQTQHGARSACSRSSRRR